MLKKLMMTAASAAVLAAGAGAAQAVDQNINLNASVSGFCTINSSLAPSLINQSIPTTGDGNVNTAPIVVPLGAVVCNNAANVSLASLKGGVFSGTSAPGFQNRINYTASVSSPAAVALNANAAIVTPTTAGPVASLGAVSDPGVNVTITPSVNTLPLVAASDYNDTLTVTIAALPRALSSQCTAGNFFPAVPLPFQRIDFRNLCGDFICLYSVALRPFSPHSLWRQYSSAGTRRLPCPSRRSRSR